MKRVIGSLSNDVLSDARQPEKGFLHSGAVTLNKFLGKSYL